LSACGSEINSKVKEAAGRSETRRPWGKDSNTTLLAPKSRGERRGLALSDVRSSTWRRYSLGQKSVLVQDADRVRRYKITTCGPEMPVGQTKLSPTEETDT